jgi:orotate phosphoribosyltransferase
MNNQINEEVIEMLRKSGGVITDSHLVYTSGKHGSIYINKDALYPHADFASRIGELFAETHKDMDIDVVAAPALGGIILETWTAHHLSKIKSKDILGVYTEKDAEKNQIFTRGYDKLVKDKNVLVIEDLTTTGGSVLKVVNTVKNAGGNVVAVAVMVNRAPETVNSEMMGVPFSSLAVLKAEAWDEADCKLCQTGVPINTTVGHGKKYLEAKKK